MCECKNRWFVCVCECVRVCERVCVSACASVFYVPDPPPLRFPVKPTHDVTPLSALKGRAEILSLHPGPAV